MQRNMKSPSDIAVFDMDSLMTKNEEEIESILNEFEEMIVLKGIEKIYLYTNIDTEEYFKMQDYFQKHRNIIDEFKIRMMKLNLPMSNVNVITPMDYDPNSKNPLKKLKNGHFFYEESIKAHFNSSTTVELQRYNPSLAKEMQTYQKSIDKQIDEIQKIATKEKAGSIQNFMLQKLNKTYPEQSILYIGRLLRSPTQTSANITVIDNVKDPEQRIKSQMKQLQKDYANLGRSTHKKTLDTLVKKMEKFESPAIQSMIHAIEVAFEQELKNYKKSFLGKISHKTDQQFLERINSGKNDYHYPRLLALMLQKLYQEYPNYRSSKEFATVKNLAQSIVPSHHEVYKKWEVKTAPQPKHMVSEKQKGYNRPTSRTT